MNLISELGKVPDHYIITKRGGPAAALISYEEYKSLLASQDVMSDRALVRDIRDGLKCAESGAVYPFEEVFEEPL
jgi:PHD/YefM family antitoxin component YafN of YafNO toxin-antitoxin module